MNFVLPLRAKLCQKKSPERKNMSDMKKMSLKLTNAVTALHRAGSTMGKAIHQRG